MSSKESFVNKGPLVNKLREGLQETVVFLRTLASYKIPAVIERRRKELLDKLCLLQGNTLKESPPVIEPPPGEKTPQTLKEPKGQEKVVLREKASPRDLRASSESTIKDCEERGESPSSNSSSVTSPTHNLTKRDSKITNLIKDYETIHFTAKKEEQKETPKRLVVLKKVSKPVDFRRSSSPTEPPGEEGKEEEKEKGKEKEEDNGEVKEDTDLAGPNMDSLEVSSLRERAPSVASSMDEMEGEESEKAGDKKKKKSKLAFGFKGKRKRDKSPAPERSPALERKAEPAAEEEQKNEEEEEEVQLADGVKICGVLERNKKKGIGHKKIKVDAKVFYTKLILGEKEELDLANCAVEETESGFDLTHPQHRSALVFKVDGPEEEKQRWVVVLRETIAEATPVKEVKEEEAVPEEAVPSPEVPSITVNEVSTPGNKSNKRESKVLNLIKKLPDQGVATKGYIHRKKPGLGRSWEKTYCVLTYQAMYFTNVEDNKDYSQMLPIYPDTETKLSETKKGKGHDKHCQVPGLTLKLGKKVEQFSFESQSEFVEWKDAIERVLGVGGVEELLSEDEELDEAIDEDLYEELEPDFIPPVPDSPRPSRPNIPAVFQAEPDDFIIDEDIYEDTDDLVLPSIVDSYQPTASLSSAPSLPGRNAPKTLPSPSLPPRSAPTGPGLPPRHPMARSAGHASSPLDYEATSGVNTGKKPAVKPPLPAAPMEDEELYDDVLVADSGVNEVEEMYDDVVIGENGGIVDEEMYDDVVAVTTGAEAEPIQEEFYEDMAPGTPDPYVTMEKKAEEDEELYVDVEEAVVEDKKPSKLVEPAKQSNVKSGTFSRMFNKKSVGAGKAGLSGALAYKPPKKSKFDDKWAVIEGSSLLIYKSSSDKRSQDKIAIGECKLEFGSTEAGAGKFAFHLSKGEKVYHFSFKEAADLEDWVGVVKGLVKYAPVEAGVAGEENVYETKEDHIGEADGELTFKKGSYIRLISRESADVWRGQIGTAEQVFKGKVGHFPANKVQLAEDLYF